MEREQTTIRQPAKEKGNLPEKDFIFKEERLWTGTLDLPEGCTLLKSSINKKNAPGPGCTG